MPCDAIQMSMRTLHDLELIVDDCRQFGILWRRVQGLAPKIDKEEEEKEIVEERSLPPAAVIFYLVSDSAQHYSAHT